MKKSELIKIIKEEITKVISEQISGGANKPPTMSGKGILQPAHDPSYYQKLTSVGGIRFGIMNGNAAVEISVWADSNMTPDPNAKEKVGSLEVQERDTVEIPDELLRQTDKYSWQKSQDAARKHAFRNLKLKSVDREQKMDLVRSLISGDVILNLIKALRKEKPEMNQSFEPA